MLPFPKRARFPLTEAVWVWLYWVTLIQVFYYSILRPCLCWEVVRIPAPNVAAQVQKPWCKWEKHYKLWSLSLTEPGMCKLHIWKLQLSLSPRCVCAGMAILAAVIGANLQWRQDLRIALTIPISEVRLPSLLPPESSFAPLSKILQPSGIVAGFRHCMFDTPSLPLFHVWHFLAEFVLHAVLFKQGFHLLNDILLALINSSPSLLYYECFIPLFTLCIYPLRKNSQSGQLAQ